MAWLLGCKIKLVVHDWQSKSEMKYNRQQQKQQHLGHCSAVSVISTCVHSGQQGKIHFVISMCVHSGQQGKIHFVLKVMFAHWFP